MTRSDEIRDEMNELDMGYWERFVSEHEELMEDLRSRQEEASFEPRREVSAAAVEQHNREIVDVSPEIPDDTIIRRYLSFPQFLSIIEGEHLWFNSAANFEDDFEGALPPANVLERDVTERFKEDTIERKFGEWAKEEIPDLDGTVWQDEMHVKHCILNCWRMGEGSDQYAESALFWNAYIPDGVGVSIESTIGQLKKQLQEVGDSLKKIREQGAVPGFYPGVYTGAVRYIDFERDWIMGLLPTRLFYKRDMFTEEREYRAVIDNFQQTFLQVEECDSEHFEYKHPPGDYVDIKPGDLINKIVISPNAPDYLFSNVEQLIDRYTGFSGSEVKQSTLDADEPTY